MKTFLTAFILGLSAAFLATDAAGTAEVDVELDTYAVLDGRAELHGRVTRKSADAADQVGVRAVPLAGGNEAWSSKVRMAGLKPGQSAGFSIPVGKMPGGSYRLETGGATNPMIFSIAALRENPPDDSAGTNQRRFLAFVLDTMKTLEQRQSARWGGEPGGTLFLTRSRMANRSYRSLGYRKEDGSHTNYWFPEEPMDYEPSVVDFDLWPVLERLSELTGDASYHDRAEAMAGAFAAHGFDKRSGLGYLGEEAGFDVVRKTVVSLKAGAAVPQFKPKNSGGFPAMPLEPLWRQGPAPMQRMFRAMFYGLVTDPASMDYNRFCRYDFSDADRQPSMKRNSGHCAFETAAGRMIHWWASCFAHTGDADCLQWAQRLADKWEAVQHPESGLVPNFFGAVASQEGASMPPGKWAETRGTALMAESLLDAVHELGQRPEGAPLAAQLTRMATQLALGTARHGYDHQRRLFLEHLHPDGRPYLETARYTFHTQEEKDAAVKRDPLMAQVPVYDGAGFYSPPHYWEPCAGTDIPDQLVRKPSVFDTVLKKTMWELGGQIPTAEMMFRRAIVLTANMPKIGAHMSGSAIDISVFHRDDGTEVWRGHPYLEMSEHTPMRSPFVAPEHIATRLEICAMMEKHGFIHFPFEFWHFDKDDAGMHILTGNPAPCRFGPVNWDPTTNEVTAVQNPLELLNPLPVIEREIAVALARVSVAESGPHSPLCGSEPGDARSAQRTVRTTADHDLHQPTSNDRSTSSRNTFT